jgi:hypothetical protein
MVAHLNYMMEASAFMLSLTKHQPDRKSFTTIRVIVTLSLAKGNSQHHTFEYKPY